MTSAVPDAADLFRALGALVGTVLLIAGASWILRRHRSVLQNLAAGSRLAVVTSRPVDARVRLVLVRRDEIEHLLAVGPAGVTLIESLPAREVIQPEAATS